MPRALLVLLIALVAVVVSTPASAAAATRYASPNGTGDCTTAATGCTFETAFTGAADGDTIVVGPGTHPGSGALLNDGFRALTIRGAVLGRNRPLIEDHELRLFASSVRDLRLEERLETNGSVERVSSMEACSVNGPVTNSACAGVDVFGETSSRNNTSTSTCSVGSAGTRSTNVACLGDPDVTDDVGGSEDHAFDFSAFETVTDPDGNITVTNRVNRLVPRGALDARQASGSPTIDAGLDAPVGPEELDLNGNLRRIGGRVDIGAYEHVPAAPAFGALAPAALTTTSATVRAALTNAGGRTYWRLQYGRTPAYGTTTSEATAPGSLTSATLAVPLTGLTPDTTYHYRWVGDSDGGTTTTPDRTFTTRALPAPTPSSTPSPSATPTPSPSPSPKPSLRVGLGVADALVKGRLSLKRPAVVASVRCRGVGCRVKVSAVVKNGRRTLGRLRSRSRVLAAGQRARLKLSVPRKLSKRLPRGTRITIRAVFTGKDGTRVTRTLRLRVRRPLK